VPEAKELYTPGTKVPKSFTNYLTPELYQEIEKIDFGPYLTIVQKKLHANWIAPHLYKKNKIVVKFLIHRDGTISGLHMVGSSGFAEADKAALDAVNKSIPLEPLPENYHGAVVPFEFTFDYAPYSPQANEAQ